MKKTTILLLSIIIIIGTIPHSYAEEYSEWAEDSISLLKGYNIFNPFI